MTNRAADRWVKSWGALRGDFRTLIGRHVKRFAIVAMGISITASALASPVRSSNSDQAHRLVEEVLTNMGAGRDVSRLSSIQFEGHETIKDLVENDHPLTPPFGDRLTTDVQRVWDYDRWIQRSDFVGPGGQTTMFLSPSTAVTIYGPAGNQRRLITTPSPSWETRDPIAALRTAERAADLQLLPDIAERGTIQHVVFFHYGKYPTRILINAATLLPTATEATITFDDQHDVEAVAWNALGDVLDRTEYMSWTVVDGVRYPLKQDELRNGDLYRSLTIRTVAVGTSIDTTGLALKPGEAIFPASVQAFRPSSHVPGPYPDKPVEEIAPWIIQIPNSWYTTIIRQRDGLVIIDAPISSGYSIGVLAEARRRFPGVPVKALVTSTGFFWHVAGVREYAARGIPIYAEARNVPVIERFLNAPHRLLPDSLERVKPQKFRIIPVTRRLIIGTGTNALTLLPVSAATQPMLMTYVPDVKLLHTAEMVQPLGPKGAILYPESLIELTDEVRADDLAVNRIIGVHMSPTPWSAVAGALRKAGVVSHRSECILKSARCSGTQ